jgi:indolepyruvate ferredoxin oxidoreductase alpha subunit
MKPFNFHDLEPGRHYPLGIVAGGVPYAVARDILSEEGRTDIPLLKIGTPYPFPERLADEFLSGCDIVLVLEEPDTVIEYFLRDKTKVLGRLSGHVPLQGELVPEVVHRIINTVLERNGLDPLDSESSSEALALVAGLGLPVRKPRLCPGCGHRAAFFSIRKTSPKAIFTSDIGCYTLGLNLGAVDTCLDMGSAITMASGFYHAFDLDGVSQPIVATIGDSTFFHSGPAGLLNAVYNDARFILVILDNQTTAMTGMQPTPALGTRADGTSGKAVSLERVVAGCGVDFLEVVDPYDIKEMASLLKRAKEYVQSPDGGIAVVIARHPCLLAYRDQSLSEKKTVTVTEACDDCGLCVDRFECPALYHDTDAGRAAVDQAICARCGVCLQVCPKGAIVEAP